MKEKIVGHTTPSGGNVFADLGFDPIEAEQLKDESDRQIKADLKIQLMDEVANVIRERHLKQEEAARVLDVTRPRVSDVMTGKASKFTIDALVDMLQKLGKVVKLQIA